jgi:hypothetical protein
MLKIYLMDDLVVIFKISFLVATIIVVIVIMVRRLDYINHKVHILEDSL